MSVFTRCPHCGFTHTRRPDGVCPRCGGALGERPETLVVAAPAPAPRPAAAPKAPAGMFRPAAAPVPKAAAVRQRAAGTVPARRRLSLRGVLASAGGGLIGIGASRWFGAALLVPAVVGLAAAAVLMKAGPARARPFAPAASVLAAHVAWMVAGAAVLGSFAPVAIDVVLMMGGTAWLLARPGLAPAVALGSFELVMLAVNAWQTTTPQYAGNEKALTLHVVLRAAALVGLAVGYVKLRAQERILRSAALAQTFE